MLIFFSNKQSGANKKVKSNDFSAIVHYILVGMTKTTSQKFIIGEIRMQLV